MDIRCPRHFFTINPKLYCQYYKKNYQVQKIQRYFWKEELKKIFHSITLYFFRANVISEITNFRFRTPDTSKQLRTEYSNC